MKEMRWDFAWSLKQRLKVEFQWPLTVLLYQGLNLISDFKLKEREFGRIMKLKKELYLVGFLPKQLKFF